MTLGRWQRVAGDAVLGTGGNILGIALRATRVGAVAGVLANVVSTALTGEVRGYCDHSRDGETRCKGDG